MPLLRPMLHVAAYLQRVVWHTPSIPLQAVLMVKFALSAELGGSSGRASVLE